MGGKNSKPSPPSLMELIMFIVISGRFIYALMLLHIVRFFYSFFVRRKWGSTIFTCRNNANEAPAHAFSVIFTALADINWLIWSMIAHKSLG
jgi:hypothetical protein